MHALLESDHAIWTYISHFFALCRGPKWGSMAQYSHPKYVPGFACPNGHSILITAWNHSTSVFERCGLLILFFHKKVLFMIKYISIFRLVLKCLLVARKENLTGFSTGLTGRSKNLDPIGYPTGFHLWNALPLGQLAGAKKRPFKKWLATTSSHFWGQNALLRQQFLRNVCLIFGAGRLFSTATTTLAAIANFLVAPERRNNEWYYFTKM